MSHEHALCHVCRPIVPDPGAEITQFPDWKTRPQNCSGDVRWRITIFVTTPTDIPVIQETIHCYDKATGARLNTRKSRALAVGGWSTNTNVLNILYQTEIKILGVISTNSFEQSMNKSWAIVTGKVRAQATETYRRDLCLSQRNR